MVVTTDDLKCALLQASMGQPYDSVGVVLRKIVCRHLRSMGLLRQDGWAPTDAGLAYLQDNTP